MNKNINFEEEKSLYLLTAIDALRDYFPDKNEVSSLLVELANKSEIIEGLEKELLEVSFINIAELKKCRKAMDQIKNPQDTFFESLRFIEEVLTKAKTQNESMDNILEEIIFPRERDGDTWSRDSADTYNKLLEYYILESLYIILTSDDIYEITYMENVRNSRLDEKMQYLESVLLSERAQYQTNRSCWYIYERLETNTVELKYMAESEYNLLFNILSPEIIKRDLYQPRVQVQYKSGERVICFGKGRICNFNPIETESVFRGGYYKKIDRRKVISNEYTDPISILSDIYGNSYYSILPEEFLYLIRVIDSRKKTSERKSSGACMICGKKRQPNRTSNGMYICADHFTVAE